MSSLLERLPAVRGKYRTQVPLAPTTWFRVGGAAEVLYRPTDLDDLIHFLSLCPLDIPLTYLGVGSNVLIRDGGIPGVVIRLGSGFQSLKIDEEILECGASVLDSTVAQYCQTEGLGGLEFLCGIPGTIGGALRMNAGCYGTEVKDCLIKATLVDRHGTLRLLLQQDISYTYRHCGLPKDWIFVGGQFKINHTSPSAVSEKVQSLLTRREQSQPVRTRTGGSTFKNLSGHHAWILIDQAGCRGLRHGGAQVSEMHCNFLINTGTATAQELEDLGEIVRQRVFETSGVQLEWEIERLGISLSEQRNKSKSVYI